MPQPAPASHHRLRWLCALCLLGVQATNAVAQPVQCHLRYHGATRTIVVPPTQCPERVWPQVSGAHLAFKVVNASGAAPSRGVTVETHTAVGEALQTSHQAHYLGWEAGPARAGMPYGFTGLQTVLVPATGQALQYWCERLAPATTSPQGPGCGDGTP